MKWINKLFGYNASEANQQEAIDEVVSVFKNATATSALVISPRVIATENNNMHTERSLNKLNKKQLIELANNELGLEIDQRNKKVEIISKFLTEQNKE
jgi:hypothetical protein|tara:strand:- start:147 stop:440 length:294 start_codon:yes stop_codon:yes gene_type:complete